MEKAGEAITDAGKTVVDKITHPVETAKGEREDVLPLSMREIAETRRWLGCCRTNAE